MRGCFLQEELSDVDREAGEKTLVRVEAAMSGDAGRAIAERVLLLEALIPFVRLATVGCLTVRQQCEAYDALAALDEKGNEDANG